MTIEIMVWPLWPLQTLAFFQLSDFSKNAFNDLFMDVHVMQQKYGL